MTKAQPGDYIIFCADKENYLAKVTGTNKTSIYGVLEKDQHLQKVPVETSESQIVLNLGANPPKGVVLGFDCKDIYHRSSRVTDDVDLHWFVKVPKEARAKVVETVETCLARLDRLGLSSVLDNVALEVRHKRGSYAGMYVHSRSELPSRIHWYVQPTFIKDKTLPYTFYHEVGHAVRYACLTDARVYSAWVRLFNRTISTTPVTAKDCQNLWAKHGAGADCLATFKQSLSEDEAEHFKTVLRYLKQVRRLGTTQVDALLKSDKHDDLRDVWPNIDIDVTDLKPLVSEYALKNVEELFAESFAFYCTNVKLPKTVLALLEKSLSIAKADLASGKHE